MKKVISVILAAVMMLACPSLGFAYTFPQSFWALNSGYAEALNANDLSNIIYYGNQIIELMKTEPECSEVIDNILTKSQDVGLAYESLGMYRESTGAFNTLFTYAQKTGDLEKQRFARERIKQYTSDIRLFTDGGTSTYFGAKNEKQNGVLFGTCWNGQTRGKLQNESVTLVYHELGDEIKYYERNVLAEAQQKGLAVEYALNCPNEGADILAIESKSYDLEAISALIKEYGGVPVYLRFGAEFDVWTAKSGPQSFISAFRYVSNYFKQRNPNVAMVWSPTTAASWDVDVHDYYPGDEYVDWVGLSVYSRKYFLADRNASQSNKVIFQTGDNACPEIMVSEFVQRYGDRKPIMVAESGQNHYTFAGLNEDTTEWAHQKLKEFYSYIPMLYPQIKAVLYFDYYVNGERDNFCLSDSPVLQNEYINRTKGARFIQGKYDSNTDFCYRRADNGTVFYDNLMMLSCYAHIYGEDTLSVTYFIDDTYVASSSNMPFCEYIDISGYSNGTHTLKAVALGSGQTSLTKECQINISKTDDKDIGVYVSGEKITFDQDPVIYNNRTLVPMRKIFEKLGASVDWDAESSTVTCTKDGKTVRITIGSSVMYTDGKQKTLDTPAIAVSGRTLVPVRAVSEALECRVEWGGNTNSVHITPDR